MTIRLVCACGKKLRGPDSARGRRIKCSCGKTMTVPADAPGAEESMVGGKPGESAFSAWKKRHLHLNFALPPEHLRRCMQCGKYRFDVPTPCASCGAATVGVNLSDMNSGRDRAYLVAIGAIDWAAHRLKGIRLVIAALALLAVVASAWWGVRAAVQGLFVASASALFLSWLAGWLMRISLEFVHPVLRDADPGRPPADARAMAQASEKFIAPFLARNTASRDSADLIPAEEVDLLVLLLARNGLHVKRDNIYSFLAACSLRNDYLAFKAEFAQFELSNPDTFEVYLTLHPDPADDEHSLPFLRQYLAEGNRLPDDFVIASKLAAARQDRKLRSLEKDLQSRQRAPTVDSVSLADVDKVDPFNFKLLVGLVYQVLGYVVRGVLRQEDKGADAILEKGGEKWVMRAKLSSEKLGTRTIQEVLEGREFYRAQHAMVVTNGGFSPSAEALAREKGVKLVDREGLKGLLDEFNSSPKEFARLTLIMRPRAAPALDEEVTFDDDDEVIDSLRKELGKTKKEELPG